MSDLTPFNTEHQSRDQADPPAKLRADRQCAAAVVALGLAAAGWLILLWALSVWISRF